MGFVKIMAPDADTLARVQRMVEKRQKVLAVSKRRHFLSTTEPDRRLRTAIEKQGATIVPDYSFDLESA